MTSTPPMVPLTKVVEAPFYPTVPEISLELTNNCNLKCPYCANIALSRAKTYIDWAFFERVVEECADRRYNLAWLHGVGEPLLWHRLEDAISLIKQKGAGTGSFGTNGTLLNADRVRRLLDAGLDSIYVSIDTLDPEIYKATRGGKLAKVIGNVQEMIRIVPNTFRITIALMDHKDHHFSQQTVAEFHRTFGEHTNVVLNRVQNLTFPGAPEDYRTEPAQTEMCFEPSSYLFIALDGRAAICCRDQDIGHTLGNVRDRSIHDVWYDPATQTTFRNVALGIYDCPDVCTQRCVLKPPKQHVTKVAAGFGLPYQEAARLVDELIAAGDLSNARNTAGALARRDPQDRRMRALWTALESQLAGGGVQRRWALSRGARSRDRTPTSP
jgi:MoaA/NifB/PqqE/SkfB family radical SAM enzyme